MDENLKFVAKNSSLRDFFLVFLFVSSTIWLLNIHSPLLRSGKKSVSYNLLIVIKARPRRPVIPGTTALLVQEVNSL